MRLRKHLRTNIWPPGKLCRRLLLAALIPVVSASAGLAQSKGATEWIPVSLNAGETYVITGIKPGAKPSFHVARNPNAFVSYESAPGTLTMLSAEAGSWIVTVTDTSDRTVSYDLNSFAVARPDAPLTPGKTPPSISDMELKSRPGSGSSTSTPSAPPGLATVSPYSVTVPA